jgi:hypothetical protein
MGMLLMTGALSASPEGTRMEGYFLLCVMTGFTSLTTTFAFEFIVTVVLVCTGCTDPTFLPESVDLLTATVTLSVDLMTGFSSATFAGRGTVVVVAVCAGLEGMRG